MFKKNMSLALSISFLFRVLKKTDHTSFCFRLSFPRLTFLVFTYGYSIIWLGGGALFGAVTPAFAQNALPSEVPVPLVRPFSALITPKPSPFDQEVIVPTLSPSSRPVVSTRLKEGLDALTQDRITTALGIRDAMARGSFERALLNWSLATSGAPGISSSEIKDMMLVLQDWPGHELMRRNFERAVAREAHDPARRIALLGASSLGQKAPQTPAGMVALANALVADGRAREARTLVVPWWHQQKMSVAEERFVLQNLDGRILQKDDHIRRMKTMLYEKRFASAEQLAPLAEAHSLVRAFVAVARKDKDAAQKLKQVDRSWHQDATYLFARIQHLRRSGQYKEAAKLMLKAPKDTKILTHPDAWWIERRALSREMLDLKKPKEAYRIAAAHSAETPAQFVDAEFHAGWYALRFLKDAKSAKKHFTRMTEFSSRPISISRSFYWLGRAEEALNNKPTAMEHYRHAARYKTTFYGQLASVRLGTDKLELPYPEYPKPTAQERARFAALTGVRAIGYLEAAGESERALTLYRLLSEELPSSGEMALLAVMAERAGNHHLSLKIGKKAVERGLDAGALSHPLGAIPASANISGAGQALAYAIARQESEFNPTAISQAGARGLLQLLPKTAKAVAIKQGIAFSSHKLGSDAAYNATLGTYFLGEQLERFNGSYILTFIGYNAGPKRAYDWIARYGDPRGRPLDAVVDWIERIPYTETRNYVQRVMENYQVYKARLGATHTIAQDLTRGRRM